MKVMPFWGCMIPLRYPQMELAVRRTMPNVGVELFDVKGFSCCPDPVYFKAKDNMAWLTMAARNLCVAEEAGDVVMTMCSGCTSTLKEASFLLAEDEKLLAEVNKRLARVGRQYQGKVRVQHAVAILRDELGMDAVRKSVTRPLTGLKVAIHYGCHLLKPSQVMGVDDADYPAVLEDLIKAIGATPIDHPEMLLCCGKGCIEEDMRLDMTSEIFKSIEAAEGTVMGLICPTCFSSFDLGQLILGRKRNEEHMVPVIYYFQLLGLAQGLSPKEVGLHLHRVKADKALAGVLSES